MNQRTKSLLDRFSRFGANPHAAPLAKAAEKCLAIADLFAEQGKAIGLDANLSERGRAAALEIAVKSAARDLREARRPIADAQERLSEMRSRVKPTSFDKSDVASQLRHQEIRTYLRSLNTKEKVATVLEGDADILDAVLAAPAALSSMPPEIYASAKAAREQQLNGPLLAEITEFDAVIEEAAAAAGVARGALKATLNVEDATFERLVAPIEKRANGVWLLNSGGTILRVRPERRGSAEFQQPATETEIADGQFFTDEAAFRAAQAA
jgi:hypothetical protein